MSKKYKNCYIIKYERGVVGFLKICKACSGKLIKVLEYVNLVVKFEEKFKK